MGEAEFLKWALQVGGPIFALAVMMFWLYRKDISQMVIQWKGQAEILIQVVTANTAAMIAVKIALDDIKADAKIAHSSLASHDRM